MLSINQRHMRLPEVPYFGRNIAVYYLHRKLLFTQDIIMLSTSGTQKLPTLLLLLLVLSFVIALSLARSLARSLFLAISLTVNLEPPYPLGLSSACQQQPECAKSERKCRLHAVCVRASARTCMYVCMYVRMQYVRTDARAQRHE